jgi:hypothetical protein
METAAVNNLGLVRYIDTQLKPPSTDKPFIEANTESFTSNEIRDKHIIPVFIKDNETVISHTDFIDTTMEIVSEIYLGETILSPSVRVSHPIKGRIPEAKDKPAKDLLEHEKTLYYERMAFIIEIPTICDDIEGSQLSLTVGGVKAYNLDNLYSQKGTDEHFKVFIGFKNRVCTNLCVSTDGFLDDLKVRTVGELKACIRHLVEGYKASLHLHTLNRLIDYSLTEHQFAQLIGRCRMYNHLPGAVKNHISTLLLSDTQIGTVVKDYYKDESFCRKEDGNINLWRLYNLFTGTNKSSYIDTFLDRSVNIFRFVYHLKMALENNNSSWFLQ